MLKEIQLKHGVAVLDEEDFDRISQFHWNSVQVDKRSENLIYATTKIARKTTYMHRMVMGAQPGEEVDHIDGNGLNNSRSNLRIATSQQNKRNQRVHKDSTSRIKGVSWSPERRKFQVYITVDWKRIPLGRFESAEEALAVRLAAEKEHFGDFAKEIDYTEALANLKAAQLPKREMIGRGRKKGDIGVRPKSHRDGGHVGVRQHKNGRWIARLTSKHLGYFDTFEQAVSARIAAEKAYKQSLETPSDETQETP